MRSDFRQPNKYTRFFKVSGFVLLFILLIYFLYSQRVNKFEFDGDVRFSDLSSIKVLAINLLKDQNILFFNKNQFEELIKEENKEIKNIEYKVVSLDKIKLKLSVIEHCCVIKDENENNFLISRDGTVIKQLKSTENIEFIKLEQAVLDTTKLNTNLLFKIEEINNQFKSEKLKLSYFKIINNYLEIKLNNEAILLIDENTDVSELEKKYNSLINHLSQNSKNYSIVDFRFDKVVVK